MENIIANNLLYLRKKAGLTQSEFGEKFNYSDKTVSKWEQGMVIPSVETLKQIADFYGISMDYLVTEHYTKKDFDSVINKTVDSRNKVVLIALSGVVIVCIAVVIYVSSILNIGTTDPNQNKWWTVFLWMVPAAFLVMAYFTQRYFKKRKATVIMVSIALWSLLLAAFVTFLYKNNYWYLFIIGVPVQVGLILLCQLNTKK